MQDRGVEECVGVKGRNVFSLEILYSLVIQADNRKDVGFDAIRVIHELLPVALEQKHWTPGCSGGRHFYL